MNIKSKNTGIHKKAWISVTKACRQYDVHGNLISWGIHNGKLDSLQGVNQGQPYTKILIHQLETLMIEQGQEEQLVRMQAYSDLRALNKKIANHSLELEKAQLRKAEIENWFAANPNVHIETLVDRE